MDLDYLASFGDHVPLSQFKVDDRINVLSFSSDGRFLGSGDGAGRVVIFSLTERPNANPTVGFVCQIHAHKSEFDYFRSELSEPKITGLKFIPGISLNPKLITCNSHEAKLWQLDFSSKIEWNPRKGDTIDSLVLPEARKVDHKYAARFVQAFTDLQTEYLIDVQCLSDQRSMLMVDVAGIKLWDIERSVPSVSLLRVPQTDPELTTAAVHPGLTFAILVADDVGRCRILDMRQQAEDLTPSIQVSTAPFLTKSGVNGSAYVSSVSFTRDATGFVCRTFGDLQQWDLRQPEKPVAVTDVHWFPNRMDYLVNEDLIKDQFRTAVTPRGVIVSGSYCADFVSWDPATGKKNKHRAVSSRTKVPPPEPGRDFTKRVTCAEAHPIKPIVAIVSTAALFLFSEAGQ
jgi:serine/threonine-protein phosphatase 2A regulatory subunit B